MGCVFYRCRQGYIKNYLVSSSTPPDLSQFIETDSNSFLYICMGTAFQAGNYTYNDFVNAMESYYPNYTVATPIETGFDSYNKIIHFWAPGFNLGNEGYESAVRGGLVVSNSDTRIWIVPGLKRVIVSAGVWFSPRYCWKYENDVITGSRLSIPNNFPIFLYAGNQTLGFTPCNGSSVADLRNREKWVQTNYYLVPNTDSYNTTRQVYTRTNNINQNDLTNLFGDADEPEQAPTAGNDPYNPGGESEPGGGTGDFDETGDDIEIPDLPTLSAVDTGFITLFNPSAGELRSLANYMWSNPLFDLDAWKKLFADPMDAILGLSIVPVAVPNGGSSSVTVGNIPTGVSMNKAAAQYVSVDCGTLNVNEFWGGYLDYDPFTKAEIYLPYIGTHPLAVDNIMGKSVHVKYHVDILSGSCCAYVKCGGSIIYNFVGQCSCSVPVTGSDWTNVINGSLSIAASIGSMVATGGASAPMAVSAIASTAVNSMKPNVEKSGSMGGMGGMLGVQTPYLILTRPRQALPRSQNKFIGYPSFITRKLSAVSGYTEIDSIHLEGIPATEQELSEIESLLKTGVIL